jgi:hypothetical protein
MCKEELCNPENEVFIRECIPYNALIRAEFYFDALIIGNRIWCKECQYDIHDYTDSGDPYGTCKICEVPRADHGPIDDYVAAVLAHQQVDS